jgi:UDP-N-acetylglucosamine--N-acetylmuramyl-(pentapeptide) pyrophosphoryl-undecaprenol N-acetylglucosamine transferase
MKIVFTGGGTGGHFYPIIAIAEEVNAIIDEQKILQAKLYYFSDTPYDKTALFDNGITYKKISAGKNRVYFSPLNFLDYFKAGFGIIQAIFSLYSIFPDVVVGKGGYASFPTLVAARLLKIPILIHESDSFPGRVNQWAGKFAKRIAVAFEEGGTYFPKDKTAVTGLPIRSEILAPAKDGMFEFLKINESMPLIVVLGGSQGSSIINDAILEALPNLIDKYQIIHQVGLKNLSRKTRSLP